MSAALLYASLKYLHVGCVVLSGAGFLLRGAWMVTGNPLLRHPLTRRLPHVVDTLLLASAIALAVMLRQYPFAAPWVTAKVLGLLAYIVLGVIALRRGPSLAVRGVALAGAVLTYAWIISVALTKNPYGYFAG
jgi:uncharacterized membrane protein SirB2